MASPLAARKTREANEVLLLVLARCPMLLLKDSIRLQKSVRARHGVKEEEEERLENSSGDAVRCPASHDGRARECSYYLQAFTVLYRSSTVLLLRQINAIR